MAEVTNIILNDDGTTDTVVTVMVDDEPGFQMRFAPGVIERDVNGLITVGGWARMREDAEEELAWMVQCLLDVQNCEGYCARGMP